jgi:hypothetical protein
MSANDPCGPRTSPNDGTLIAWHEPRDEAVPFPNLYVIVTRKFFLRLFSSVFVISCRDDEGGIYMSTIKYKDIIYFH